MADVVASFIADHDPSVLRLRLLPDATTSDLVVEFEAVGAVEGAPKPYLHLSLDGTSVGMSCADEDGDDGCYEGFNSAANRFCYGGKPPTLLTALAFAVEQFSSEDSLAVLRGDEDDSDDSSDSDSEPYYSYDDSDNEAPSALPPQPVTKRQTSYEDGLQAKQRQQLLQVSSRYAISTAAAAILLRHMRWDAKALHKAWLADKHALAASAGASLSREVVSVGTGDGSDDEVECRICMDDVPLSDTRAISCGHVFCSECWTDHLLDQIRDVSGGLSAVCPEDECTAPLGEDVFQFFLAGPHPEAWEKYSTSLLNSFVADNDSITWCPAPGCERAVGFSTRKRTVTCDCGATFCFKCKEAPHAPVSCNERNAWLKFEAKRKKSGAGAAMLNVKPCPKCSVATNKDGGCMFMTCSSCHTNWCWQCGEYGPNVHHVYSCNKPKNKAWQGTVLNIDGKSGRFDFYHERYTNHKQARELTETQRSILLTKQEELLDAGEPAYVVQFFIRAVNLVVRCRYVLTWSYCYAFFTKDETKRTLFEYAQEQLELFTERLSKLTEQPVWELSQSRDAMEALTVSLSTYCANMEAYEPIDADLAKKAGEVYGANLRSGDGASSAGAGATAGAGAGETAGAGAASGAGAGAGAAKLPAGGGRGRGRPATGGRGRVGGAGRGRGRGGRGGHTGGGVARGKPKPAPPTVADKAPPKKKKRGTAAATATAGAGTGGRRKKKGPKVNIGSGRQPLPRRAKRK